MEDHDFYDVLHFTRFSPMLRRTGEKRGKFGLILKIMVLQVYIVLLHLPILWLVKQLLFFCSKRHNRDTVLIENLNQYSAITHNQPIQFSLLMLHYTENCSSIITLMVEIEMRVSYLYFFEFCIIAYLQIWLNFYSKSHLAFWFECHSFWAALILQLKLWCWTCAITKKR